MQTNPAVEQHKNVKWSQSPSVRGISPVGEEKVCRGKVEQEYGLDSKRKIASD